MIFPISFVITSLFASIMAVAVKEVTPFSIEDVWESSKTDCSCKPIPIWARGVQKYYDDIIEAFGKFPPGPLLDQSNVVMTTFQNFFVKLVNSSNSNSTVLSSGATAILGVLSKVKLLVNTPIGVINEFQRVLPALIKTYKGVITNLTKIIGDDVACSVNDAMVDLECSFKDYMTKFLSHGSKKKIDYKPVTKHFEAFNSTISRFAEGVNNKCKHPAAPEVQDSVTVLNLVLSHLTICFYGLSGCSEAVLFEKKC